MKFRLSLKKPIVAIMIMSVACLGFSSCEAFLMGMLMGMSTPSYSPYASPTYVPPVPTYTPPPVPTYTPPPTFTYSPPTFTPSYAASASEPHKTSDLYVGYKDKAILHYSDVSHHKQNENGVHGVWCDGDLITIGSDISLLTVETVVKEDTKSAPSIGFTFDMIMDTTTKLYSICNNLTKAKGSKMDNITLQITLENDEILTSSRTKLGSTFLGLGVEVSTSLVNFKSNKKSLTGDLSSVKYCIDCLSCNKIKSISFEGCEIDLSSGSEILREKILYCFYRMAKEAERSDLLLN